MSDQLREQQAEILKGMITFRAEPITLSDSDCEALKAGAAALRAPVRPQEKNDQARSAQPQLRAGEADPRDGHRGSQTRYAGRLSIPYYVFHGQCEPEYDQGHSVVVWYDDLYDLAHGYHGTPPLSEASPSTQSEAQEKSSPLSRVASSPETP